LHVSLEFRSATLGGLGTVVTQMHAAQNRWWQPDMAQSAAMVVTPYYKKIYTTYNHLTFCGSVTHKFNNLLSITNLFYHQSKVGIHFVLEPTNENEHLFDIPSIRSIYSDTTESSFINRFKYFNS